MSALVISLAVGTGVSSSSRDVDRGLDGRVGTIGEPSLPHVGSDQSLLRLSPNFGTGSRAAPGSVPKCRSARQAVAHYRALVWTRQDARSGARATRSPVARRRTCHWARYAAEVWVARAQSAKRALEDWRREFAWWIWLPSNWSAVARCETHFNFRHANGRFVSAFGISRREYDADAAYFGAPPWNDRRPPTPREQYDAARGHYARFGDGWTCPGP